MELVSLGNEQLTIRVRCSRKTLGKAPHCSIGGMGTAYSHRQVTCSPSSILAPTVILHSGGCLTAIPQKTPRPEAFPGLIAFGFYIHYSVFPPKLLNIRRPRHAGVASGGPTTTLPWPTWHKTLSTDCQALSQAVTTPMSGA